MTDARSVGPRALRVLDPGLPSGRSAELVLVESPGIGIMTAESVQQEYEQILRVWMDRLR